MQLTTGAKLRGEPGIQRAMQPSQKRGGWGSRAAGAALVERPRAPSPGSQDGAPYDPGGLNSNDSVATRARPHRFDCSPPGLLPNLPTPGVAESPASTKHCSLLKFVSW